MNYIKELHEFLDDDMCDIKGLFVNSSGFPIELSARQLEINMEEVQQILTCSLRVFTEKILKDVLSEMEGDCWSEEGIFTKKITDENLKKFAKKKYDINLDIIKL